MFFSFSTLLIAVRKAVRALDLLVPGYPATAANIILGSSQVSLMCIFDPLRWCAVVTRSIGIMYEEADRCSQGLMSQLCCYMHSLSFHFPQSFTEKSNSSIYLDQNAMRYTCGI